ncbi:hypothetical protein GALMADRAFT_247885 [Galerina marginata CBS 339.88]|uniref:Uncharacterized protein n=1 Tax=Galerina marginata (strain CBS 339.88) TaxID=685588 RepID=A0A067TBP8_GALM3|nr:hypothetical protein GALMADRAFT_247885 [Galerina marginata CBS 339.88]
MSDVRALLKAKRQEARIIHPYATYNPSGQLKCSVCGSIVKHASAWEGHLGSKVHRTNIAHLREQEENRQEISDNLGKRKADGDQTVAQIEKRRRVDISSQEPESFPQNFFSDPSHAPVILSQDSDAEDDDIREPQKGLSLTTKSDIDVEYERFQRELLNKADADPSEAYDRATVAAEPVFASPETSGFPAVSVEEASQEPAQLTDVEARSKREQEERELIMDRLLAEERAQEDADMRVQLLKTKLVSFRSKREAAKAKRPNHTR